MEIEMKFIMKIMQSRFFLTLSSPHRLLSAIPLASSLAPVVLRCLQTSKE